MKEKCINAVQNIGAVLFIIGLFCLCMSVNVFTAVVCFAVCLAGVVLIAIAELMINKLEQREKQKNKCHRTAKHIDTY